MKYLTSLFTHLLIKPCNHFDQQSLFSRANSESMKEFVITPELSLCFFQMHFLRACLVFGGKTCKIPSLLVETNFSHTIYQCNNYT